MGRRRFWIAAIAVCALLISAVFLYGILSGPSAQTPEYDASLSFSTIMDEGGAGSLDPGPGTVRVEGTIHNTGTAPGTASLEIIVNTGYANQTFHAITGEIAPGGSVQFQWERHFDMIDPLACILWYTFSN